MYYQTLWLCCGMMLLIVGCSAESPHDDILPLSAYDETTVLTVTTTAGDTAIFSSPLETPDMPSFSLEITDTTDVTDEVTLSELQQVAADAAIAELALQLGISPSQITITSVDAVDWPDSSLGCPQEGFMYAQVVTPGFKIVLTVNNQPYIYHTDNRETVILCETTP